MKKYYEPLEMEITKFTAAPDILTASFGGGDLGDGEDMSMTGINEF